MRKILLSFVLVMLASAGFAGVGFAQAGRINVVGVDSEGNGMVIPLDVEIVPGKGRILITSVPFTGVDTQASENAAVGAALNFTGQELGDRDVIFVFNTNVTLVEGPSAGAAMALATVSALQGKEIRQDAVVSGIIEESGAITLSGSLLQKAYACRRENLFVVGRDGTKIAGQVSKIVRDEEISLNEVDAVVIDLEDYAMGHWGLDVIEVHNLTHAVEILFAPADPGRAPGNVSFALREREFKENMLSRSAHEFSEKGWVLLEELKEHYNESRLLEAKEQLEKSEKYQELGYEYSAANYAFLATITLKTMKDRHEQPEWAPIYQKAVEKREIPDYGTPIHYIVGAQERYSWAQNVADLLEEEPADINGSYYSANLIMTWLEIVDRFLAEAEAQDMVFSSEIVRKADKWQERAEEEIAADDALGVDQYGAGSLLNAVERERQNGWYYASVYDGINAAGRAAAEHATPFETVELMKKAEENIGKAQKVGLGFWAENYLENSQVALVEDNTKEAYAYAFMANEYAKFDLYAAGVPVVETLPEPVYVIAPPEMPEVRSFWDGICEILGRWCWRGYIFK